MCNIHITTYFVITQQITTAFKMGVLQNKVAIKKWANVRQLIYKTSDRFCWVGFVKFDDQLQKQKKKKIVHKRLVVV